VEPPLKYPMTDDHHAPVLFDPDELPPAHDVQIWHFVVAILSMVPISFISLVFLPILLFICVPLIVARLNV
jgi:hypothetical protein